MQTSINYLVLSAISNDYEDFETVFGEVAKWVAERGVSISRQEIAGVLDQLIKEGFARAYILAPQLAEAQPVLFSSQEVDRLWFYVTPQGKRLVMELDRDHRTGNN